MSFSNFNPSGALQKRLAEKREVRWAFLEERLRLRLFTHFERQQGVLGLSQRQLAAKSGTTQPMVSRLFSGNDSRSPTLETLVKIADALGKELDVSLVEPASVSSFDWNIEEAAVPTSVVQWGTAITVVEGAVPSTAVVAGWPWELIEGHSADTAVEA